MNNLLKKVLPHLVAIVLFIVASYAYFSPLLQNKALPQHDIEQFKGSAKELMDFRERTGEESFWTNSMFGGMPSYLISSIYKGNLLRYVDKALSLLERPASFMFLTLLGFYILLLVMGLNAWLSIVGAFAYGLSSYFFIVIGAGHNAKIHAIAYVAPMVAGVVLAYKGKYLGGLALFSLFFGLNLFTGHPQITFYAAFILLALVAAYFADALIKKQLVGFAKASGMLVLAGILAIGANSARLYSTYDYGKDSIRGPSELKRHESNQTSGLDKDYATAWSYGRTETLNMLIPNLYGGSSSADLGADSETYQALVKNGVPRNQARTIVRQLPVYWGPQPMTSGPVYIGATVIVLFLMGLFLVRGPFKWAIVAVTSLGIALAMGKHLPWLTNFFLNYFPGYNKFRTVSMILYIAEFTMPLLGMMALKQIYDGQLDKKRFVRALQASLGIAGGICLFFLLFGKALFHFESFNDMNYIAMGYPAWLFDSLMADRANLLRADALRSLLFVLLSGGAILAYFYKRLKPSHLVLVMGLLIIADLWTVNRRYLNNSHFAPKSKVDVPFVASNADKQILADKSLSYRVYNTTVSPFNDASTSYFHKSIGGYHGAKLRRYQEVIDYHLGRQNPKVFNMLNTKYFIQEGKEGPTAMQNQWALGNAWFVNDAIWVEDADAELDSLNVFNPQLNAVIDKRFEGVVEQFSSSGSEADHITLTHYQPNQLKYEYSLEGPRLTVFSEIYYPKGWKAYLDGKSAEHFRVNYILRGMVLPAGSHQVDFQFKPKMIGPLSKVELVFSLLIILIVLGWLTVEGLALRKGA